MKNEQSELVKFIINPAFLEQIGHSHKDFKVWVSDLSFEVLRNGIKYVMTFSIEKDAKVKIKLRDSNSYVVADLTITDHCQNIEEFLSLLEKLDDLAKRIPSKSN